MGMSSDFDVNKHDVRFLFQRRFQKVDWKKIAAANIDDIVEELDFKVLLDNISSITYCHIENEVDVKTVDPNFVKLFKLAQLTIEYLMHSQDYLTGAVNTLEEKIRNLQDDLGEMQKERDKAAQVLNVLQNEKKKNKKLLLKQQEHLLNETAANCHKCLYCPKKFFTFEFLNSHMLRRHADQANHFNACNENFLHLSVPQPLASTDNKVVEMVEKELKEIKQMLIKPDYLQTINDTHIQNVSSTPNNKAQYKEEGLVKEIEMWRQEIEKHKKDLNNMCDMFMSELREINEKHQKYDRSIAELKQIQSVLPQNPSFAADPSINKEVSVAENSVLKETIREMCTDCMEDALKKQKNELLQMISDNDYENHSKISKLSQVFRNAISDLQAESKKGVYEEKFEDKFQELMRKPEAKAHEKYKTEDKFQKFTNKPEDKFQTFMNEPEDKFQEFMNKPEAKVYKKDRTDRTSFSTTHQWSSSPVKVPPSPPVRTSKSSVTSVEKFVQKSVNKYGMERSENLTSAIKSSPNLLTGLLPDLKGLVDDKLEQCGIKPQLPVMSNSFLNKKLSVLQKERDGLAEKFKEFSMLRKYYNTLADDIARAKLQKLIKEKPQTSLKLAESIESPIKRYAEIPETKNESVIVLPESGDHSAVKIAPKPYPRKLTFAEPAAQTLDVSAKTMDLKPPPISPIPRKSPAVMQRQMSIHSGHAQKGDNANFYPSDSSDLESTISSLGKEEPKVVHVMPTSKTNIAFRSLDPTKIPLNSTGIQVASQILKYPSQSMKMGDADEVSSLLSIEDDSVDQKNFPNNEENKSAEKKLSSTSVKSGANISGPPAITGQISIGTSSGKNTLTSVSSWDSEDDLSMEEIQ